MVRRRLDAELVRRGLVPSRTRAQVEIEAGHVTVGGALAQKANRMVDPAEAVELLGPPPRFVSRGGEKLDAALDHFEIDVSGMRVLDAGASTGGFTDCVLQRGATEVVALDVGHAQLHERLIADRRVRNLERTHVRDLNTELIDGPVDLVVVDLSFISLRNVIDPLLSVCSPGAPLVLLVKPQFEAGKSEADKGGGVIRDANVWRRTLDEVACSLRDRGARVVAMVPSPITGAKGNVEFLVHASSPDRAESGTIAVELDALLDAVIDAARDPKVN